MASTFTWIRAHLRLLEAAVDFVDGRPIVNRPRTLTDVPAQTDFSKKISKELARRGFRFCGPTTTYAFMRAVGIVNDHLVSYHRYKALA